MVATSFFEIFTTSFLGSYARKEFQDGGTCLNFIWNGILNRFFPHILLWQVVAGGGAVEAALSEFLENLATTLGSREQLAIAEFAEALLVIPKVGLDSHSILQAIMKYWRLEKDSLVP